MINPSDFLDPHLLKSQANSHLLEWKITPNLPYFTGHFPEQPVLPAVAILDLSIELVKWITKNTALEIQKLKLAKFYETILPNQLIQIHMDQKDLNEWILIWSIPSQTKKHLAKVHMNLMEAQETKDHES